MSEIEKIKRYIERAELKVSARYDMNMAECKELSRQTNGSSVIPLDIITLAFDYGRVKGYRAAQAEARRGQAN